MTSEPSPARYTGDGWSDPGDGTMPIVETNSAVLSNCLRCGRAPQEAAEGLVENMRVEDGVMYGDAICIDCLTDDELVEYKELIRDAQGEGS